MTARRSCDTITITPGRRATSPSPHRLLMVSRWPVFMKASLCLLRRLRVCACEAESKCDVRRWTSDGSGYNLDGRKDHLHRYGSIDCTCCPDEVVPFVYGQWSALLMKLDKRQNIIVSNDRIYGRTSISCVWTKYNCRIDSLKEMLLNQSVWSQSVNWHDILEYNGHCLLAGYPGLTTANAKPRLIGQISSVVMTLSL